ncbi:MAG TPA: RluA family pseudouridine synthase [Anaeromyxobacteraceae bacterium]|nr:RluA family pseudouridine synthase [Anaeromyxobacteraceae bacterium]
MRRRVQLPAGAAGRLDRALADALGAGRAAVKAAFRAGQVRAGGRRVRGSDPARPGLEVEVELPEAPGPPAPEPGLPLVVLAESPRWLVADKPAGVATHPLRAGEGGSLAAAVAARHPECALAAPAPREGGAVHRLDRETSGCVLFARDREAWEFLHQRFARREVEKSYLALVAGRMEAGGVCSVPLAQRGGRSVPVPDELAADRLSGRAGPPRPAETRFEPERRLAGWTLLRIGIATGVMHQIRAHLAFLGHPVAGDALYGGAAAAAPGLSRHFLHASGLAFDRPEGGRATVESPLPPELTAFLAGLEPA